MTDVPTQLISDHEAGHAIVALWLGRSLTKVQIVSRGDPGEAGSCGHDPGFTWGERATIEDIFLNLGGMIAQQKRYPKMVWLCGTGDDWEGARKAAALLAPEHAPAMLEGAKRVVEKVIKEHWAGIEAISDALVERGSLDDETILAVLPEQMRISFELARARRKAQRQAHAEQARQADKINVKQTRH